MSEVVATAQQGLAGKYQPYPEYNDSGSEWLGRIPAHWQLVTLKHECVFSGGGTPTKDNLAYWDGDIPWISPKDMKSQVITDSIDKITAVAVSESSTKLVPEGALLMVVRSGILQRTIPVAINAVPVTLNQDMKALRFSSKDKAYFFLYYIQGLEFQLLLEWCKQGATVESIEHELLANARYPRPPNDELKAINQFLDYETDRIDRLIAQQQRLIELLKEKRQAVISHSVTKGLNPNAPMKDSGIEWLGQVPEHWVVTTLKRYWGVFDCKHITAEFIDDGIPLASIREVQSWEVDLSNAKQTSEEYYNALIEGGRIPENGDIIYSRNATVGEAARVTAEHPRFAMGQDVCLLKRISQLIDTDFFMYQLKSRIISYQLDTLMVGSTFKRINVDDIRNFVVVVPPEDEAVAIRSYLNDFDRKYKNIEVSASRQVSLLQERRTALIFAAVTGKIDLRGWTPPAEEAAS